jgi:hypothetical protein
MMELVPRPMEADDVTWAADLMRRRRQSEVSQAMRPTKARTRVWASASGPTSTRGP